MSETLLDQAQKTNEGADPAVKPEATPPADNNTPTADDKKTAEDGKKQEEKPAGAPEKYDLKAGEGQEFDSDFLTVYSETAKELNLTNEQAQTLIDKVSPAIAEANKKQLDGMVKKWEEDARADQEFGGDKLDESLATAKVAVEKLATPELKTLLNQSGLGNHPEVLRLFVKVGNLLKQDSFVSGTKPQGAKAVRTFTDMADAMYK